MLFLNKFKNSELVHSSTRTHLKVEVLRSVHAERVLVLAPHPDDDVFGCGALLNHLANNKAHIKSLVFCSGALGNKEGHRDIELVATREKEAVSALREIGAGEANFLRYNDLKLEGVDNLWEKIYHEFQVMQPDLVLMPDGRDWNEDHVAVYSSALIAHRKLRRNKPAMWGYYVWGLNKPSYLFPFDNRTKNIKLSAMSKHKSQLKVKRYDEAIIGMNEYLGKGLGLEHLAEGYREII